MKVITDTKISIEIERTSIKNYKALSLTRSNIHPDRVLLSGNADGTVTQQSVALPIDLIEAEEFIRAYRTLISHSNERFHSEIIENLTF